MMDTFERGGLVVEHQTPESRGLGFDPNTGAVLCPHVLEQDTNFNTNKQYLFCTNK